MGLHPNAAIVARHLRDNLKLSDAQIAGVLGNLSQESGFNSRVNEGGAVGAPKAVGGFGLAQWTGGRQTNLINFAKQRKMDPGDPNLQAQFLTAELQGPEKRALSSLQGAVSPEQSALVFRRDYERAGVPKDENRFKAARTALGQLGSLGPAPGAATTQAVEKGNNLGNSLVQQVLKQLVPAAMQQRSATGLLMDSNLAMADAMPDDYLNLFA
jgi:hypothetical protein